MEWVEGVPADLKALERASRQVDGLHGCDLSDLARLLWKLGDAGWECGRGRRPFLRRLRGTGAEDTKAITAAAEMVEGLEYLEIRDLDLLLRKLAGGGWYLQRGW